MMDAKYRTEIKAREQAATPGPWKHEYTTDGAYVHNGDAVICRCTQLGDEADFIAHARTDTPALIAEVEWLTEELIDYPHMEKVLEGQQNQNIRLRKIIDSKDQQIITLKRALKLACDDAADGCCPNEMTDYVCPNAQTCPNANGNREDSGIDKGCWYGYYIQHAQEQEGKK